MRPSFKLTRNRSKILFSPYLVWKLAQEKIAELEEKKVSSLKFEFLEREKIEFSKLLSELSSIAFGNGPLRQSEIKLQATIGELRSRQEQFLPDEKLWNLCNDAVHYCKILIQDRREERPNITDRKTTQDLVKNALTRLQE